LIQKFHQATVVAPSLPVWVLRAQLDEVIPKTFRRQPQISLGRAQSALPHVRGKRWDQAIQVPALPEPSGEPVHRECRS